MSRKDRFLCLLVCAVFGFVGGAVSNLGFLNVKSAEAQQGQVVEASVVRAQRFEVVDSSKNRQAELGLNKNGDAELNLYSKAPKSRSTLNGFSLYFYDDIGANRLAIGYFSSVGPGEAGPEIHMWNSKGKEVYNVSK